MHLASTQALTALSLFDDCPLKAVTEELATKGGDSLGAIFTRREVVDFILDLSGYTPDQPLHERRFLEPSSGGGDFLLPAISRLIASWKSSGQKGDAVKALSDAVRAVELHRDTFETTREAVRSLLIAQGIKNKDADELVTRWLHQGDFLLAHFVSHFDYVVGNPPYVRQELIPAPLLAEYRTRYRTMYDRADIYVAFLERSLSLLNDRGRLGFICADRWMKNKYGGPLRRYVAESFHLNVYVDMTDTPAFHSDVIAYPAITLISREHTGPTRIAHRPDVDKKALADLSELLLAAKLPKDCELVREVARVTNGTEPWLIDSSDQMAVIRKIEARFPAIEEVGCKVGIGVATGADKAFIGDYASMDVEPSRKVPLVTTRDIMSGEVNWQGQGVINPFADAGGLVDLNEYPRLRAYLEARREAIAGRHVAQKSPANWYRTIDRITPPLVDKPKLLVPDIKGEAHIVFEEGKLYPHHNLYFITSDEWDLRALQAVLLSAVARLFVATYSTKMRGGFLRFQAQYLRRIRVPHWSEVSPQLRKALISAAKKRDIEACNASVFKLYDLNPEERAALGGNGD
jgi:hypothetical protein